MRLIGTTALLLVLSAVAVIGADEWGWLPLEDGLQGEEKVREKRQDIGVLPASQQNVTEVSDEDILKFILDSGRQGRSLEGFDEVYSDPSVQDALQNADDAQARNIIKDKLCSLGLMQCDGQGESIEGKRPYYPIYAQQQPPRPRPPVRGPPLPPQQYAQRPPQPPQQQAYPPKPQHQGPYGPPKPMPVPNHAQHKIGYAGPQQRPPYSGPPNSFAGPSYASAYPSKPLGPIYEGDTPPFEFEPIGAGEKLYEGPLSKPGLVLNEGPLVKPVEQHIHHHYHHIDGAADSKTVVVNNPGPVGASVLSGSAVVGGSSSSSFNSGLYSAGGVYGGAQGLSGGGFSPLAGSDFDYKELKGVNNNNGFGQSGVYAAQSKPVFEGSSSSFGQGSQSSLYNQGPAQFGSNSLYSGESSSTYQGGNGAGFHSSNPALYKKELNVKGPAASNGLGTYSGNSYSKYSQYANGQYAANGGQFGSSGGQFGANGGQFGANGGQQFGANGGQQFGANGGQFGANGGQYSQFANGNGIEDCVCVPYDQCPAQDVIGRKDDLILPLDPRNLKTDIEAAADEVVITDGNGTMTVVRVPKNATAEPETKTKKISKREAAEGKSNEAKDKASIEPSVPTPAPGHAQGSPTISFPSSRRRRRATDVSVPESLEEGQETVKQVEESVAVESSSVQEKSFSTEKRQAYYGPRPGQQQQQCSGRQVCCRKPVYRNPASQNLGKCGVRNAQGINGRIKNPVYVDGDSEFGEYPWQVAILKKDPKESVYVCGGTLIDNLYIITAAHCVKTYNGFDLRVRLGEWDVNHDVEFYPYIERDIISVQVHPEYYAGTLDNDLAILKMDRPVDLTSAPHIAPACLPDKHTDFSGQRCWTTGWGKDAFGDYGKYQNILKEVDVPIVNHYQCQNQLRQTRLGYTYNLNQGFICAGGEEGKDACKGDGGGPLVCERNGVWQVVGVVSWGIGCGQANVPGVYVKVAHYLDWINQVRGRF